MVERMVLIFMRKTGVVLGSSRSAKNSYLAVLAACPKPLTLQKSLRPSLP